LRLVEGDADALPLVFGRVPEQLLHLRPELLLLHEERAVGVGASATIPARGLPADDALVEHQHVDAIARQPPAGAEARDAAANDDDRCARDAGPAHFAESVADSMVPGTTGETAPISQ